ncbi:hypothetical protein [Nonomuraea sp. NPDC049750]|uniref:hypothetical protein n=1 Tax=Nonomuraea sp. NPDC049750 TaxID=3154738 RepID=UPI0033E72A79
MAAIQHPMPAPGTVEPEEMYSDACWKVDEERKESALYLEMLSDNEAVDPLLAAIESARASKERAEEEIRQLVAYGREFIRPRPYTLNDLAAAAGMSVSGVRTCYDHTQVAAVAEALGRASREWRATDSGTPANHPDSLSAS